jgi:Holliday junction resolvasome RuvABC endonuclease subunit
MKTSSVLFGDEDSTNITRIFPSNELYSPKKQLFIGLDPSFTRTGWAIIGEEDESGCCFGHCLKPSAKLSETERTMIISLALITALEDGLSNMSYSFSDHLHVGVERPQLYANNAASSKVVLPLTLLSGVVLGSVYANFLTFLKPSNMSISTVFPNQHKGNLPKTTIVRAITRDFGIAHGTINHDEAEAMWLAVKVRADWRRL